MNALTSQQVIDPMLNLREVRAMVLYSPSQIYRLIKVGEFPDRVRLGPARVGWRTSDIVAWLNSRQPASLHKSSDSSEVDHD